MTEYDPTIFWSLLTEFRSLTTPTPTLESESESDEDIELFDTPREVQTHFPEMDRSVQIVWMLYEMGCDSDVIYNVCMKSKQLCRPWENSTLRLPPLPGGRKVKNGCGGYSVFSLEERGEFPRHWTITRTQERIHYTRKKNIPRGYVGPVKEYLKLLKNLETTKYMSDNPNLIRRNYHSAKVNMTLVNKGD